MISIFSLLDERYNNKSVFLLKVDLLLRIRFLIFSELILPPGSLILINFFFLDQPFPTLVKYLNKGNSRSAIRLSEYEPPQMSYQFSKKIDWIWADCFNNYFLNEEISNNLQKMEFKVCLVSPELQGRMQEKENLEAENMAHHAEDA